MDQNADITVPASVSSRTLQQARVGFRIASLGCGLVSLAHLARFWSGWRIQVGGWDVGPEVSAAAVFILAGLSLWFWQLALKLTPASSAAAGASAAGRLPEARRHRNAPATVGAGPGAALSHETQIEEDRDRRAD